MTHQARNELILEYYDLVPTIAARLKKQLPGSVEMDELISAGTVGLIEAVDRFDPERGELKSFVEIRVRGAMVDMVRRNGWVPRSVRRKAKAIEEARRSFTVVNGRTPTQAETARTMGMSSQDYASLENQAHSRHLVSLDAPINDEAGSTLADMVESDALSADEIIDEQEMRVILSRAMSRLSERQRTVVTLCYRHGLTLREVGEMLGVTESRVCQIRSQALRKLRAGTWIETQTMAPAMSDATSIHGANDSAPVMKKAA